MLTALHQQIRRTIRKHALIPSGSRVLVGLSGGSDSVALTFLLLDLAEHGGFSVVALAHLNHRMRPTADRDAGFCRDLAGRLGLPFIVESLDVHGYATAQRLSPEDAARRLRYDFLSRAAADVRADRIAVGHTQDDQAETFLLKLMRGAGLTGLAGIYPQKGAVIRPVLDVSREDLRRYLESRAEPWMDDESNADLSNPRNRIRHRVLPELDLAYGASTRPAIARAAALVRDDARWLDSASARRFDDLVVTTPDGLEIEAAVLAREPEPIQRRVVLTALRAVAGPREVGLDHVDLTVGVLDGSASAADVPGARVELRRGKLVLYSQGHSPK